MKVILTHEVSGLGATGDVVDVKRGYARNFLFRRGLATAWTKGAQSQVDAMKRARQARAIASLEEAQSIKGNLENKEITLSARAGESGRLYGAVTSADIATAVADSGAGTIDRRKVEVPQPIRSVGEHTVLVRLHAEVAAQFTLQVVAS